MSLIFLGNLSIQILAVFALQKVKLLKRNTLPLVLLIPLNIYFFYYTLGSITKYQVLAIALTAVIFFYILVISGRLRVVLLFSTFFLLCSLAPIVADNLKIGNSQQQGALKSGLKAKRNVYTICIDAMVSSEAFKKLYFGKSVATQKLESLGFATYDIQAPNKSTLFTYASLLEYDKDVTPNNFRRLFNGLSSSRLYTDLKKLNFKRQFFSKSNYFGTDQGKIDKFYPLESNFCNFCSYVNDQWGWYFCRIFKNFNASKDNELQIEDRFELFKKNTQSNFSDSNKWFSIHHIPFPAHTSSNSYDPNIELDRKNWRKYYIDAQIPLSKLFSDITGYILSSDPNAVIVFFGDHGSYQLRGLKDGDVTKEFGVIRTSDLLMDSNSSLLAVYPSSFCKKEIMSLGNNTEYLFYTLMIGASR
ncbi:alkaline phosphatase family protein [Daejeonella lutea]|nr:hypothetical protein [Daejeonella lutea]